MNSRIIYPDICKFVAIFAVTIGHCAQAVSGEVYTNILGGSGILIAFHMPLFMMLSGWFLDFEKIRDNTVWNQIKQKMLRLLVPSVVWSLIYHILAQKVPSLSSLITFYWYLSTLFLCHCIIVSVFHFVRNNAAAFCICMILSLLIVHDNILKVSFMMPFLLSGYLIRKWVDSSNINTLLWLSSILSLFFLLFWDVSISVYSSPFSIQELSLDMIKAYVLRFFIGFSLSLFVICIAKKLEKMSFMPFLANIGSISLVIYTFSFIVNGLVSQCVKFLGFSINQYVIIDVLSIVLALIICVLTYFLVCILRKNRWLRLILCGEK